MNKTITQTLAELKKGCGKQINSCFDYEEIYCGDKGKKVDIRLCPTCQAKRDIFIETARLILDDMIKFLKTILLSNKHKEKDCLVIMCKAKLKVLQKQREELK